MVGKIHQPSAEESKVLIDMINEAQPISNYISEGLELKYDVEEQGCQIDELDQLAIHEIQTSSKDLKANADYISAETDYHL